MKGLPGITEAAKLNLPMMLWSCFTVMKVFFKVKCMSILYCKSFSLGSKAQRLLESIKIHKNTVFVDGAEILCGARGTPKFLQISINNF